MSIEGAVKFVQKIGEDDSFKARFEAANSHEEVVRLASQSGYELSMEELKAVAGKLRGELSEEELESVAGGGFFTDVASAVGSGAGAIAGAVAGTAGSGASAVWNWLSK